MPLRFAASYALVQSTFTVMPKKGSSNLLKNSKCVFRFQLAMSNLCFTLKEVVKYQ